MVAAETCDRSTIIPSRFISRMTSSPKGVRPPLRLLVGGRVDPAQRVGMGERHVPRTAGVVAADGDRLLDRVSSLDTDQAGDLALGRRASARRP